MVTPPPLPPRLLLVPTPLEFDFVRPRLAAVTNVVMDICGFGPVSSAARTAQLIEWYQPSLVILLGIAGRINETLEVGRAYRFTEVAMYGVGAGVGDSFLPAGELGWPHWWAGHRRSDQLPERIGDIIPLTLPQEHSPPDARQLLTCCAASGTFADVRVRLRNFPDAVAEDMEGFSVALAAQLRGVPVEIIRGISNQAGDRNKVRWKVHDALIAAATLATELLK